VKHMHNLSDEVLCVRRLENPYYRFFCGELSFCHRLPFDRPLLTDWRQRVAEEHLRRLSRRACQWSTRPGRWRTRLAAFFFVLAVGGCVQGDTGQTGAPDAPYSPDDNAIRSEHGGGDGGGAGGGM
jgi:hypothetical protein